MGNVALEARLVLEIKSRTNWDEPPVLFFIVRDDDEQYHLRPVPIPVEWWMITSPPGLLKIIALAYGSGKHPGIADFAPPDEGWVGFAFMCEGWKLEADPDAPEAVEAAMEAAEGHVIHEHPGRVESRHISAWTSTDEHVTCDVERASGKVDIIREEPDGAVPAALHAMVLAVAARETADEPER